MYPYLKELTLDEAHKLQEEIKKGVIPDIKINLSNSSDIDSLACFNDLTYHYSHNGKLSITALDYATHILNQQAPPEGWGYAAYELSSGMYDTLDYIWLGELTGNWNIAVIDSFKYRKPKHTNWNVYTFSLTDLARVEGTNTDTEAAPIPPSGIKPPLKPTNEFVRRSLYEREYKELKPKYETLQAKYKELEETFELVNKDQDETNASLSKQLESATARIAELEKTIESRERQIDKQQGQISKLISAYERKLDALGSLQAVEIDLQAILNEVQPLLPF
jgi:DNA repair exonuclease SbcCD ATPase subunit